MEPGEKTCQPGFDTIRLFQSFEGRRFKGDFDEKSDGFGALARARGRAPHLPRSLLSRDGSTLFFF